MSLIGGRGGVLGAAASVSAGSSPAAGTVILGVVDETDAGYLDANANYVYFNGTALTATWTESAATVAMSKARARLQGWDGGNVKVLLYSSAGSLLASSNTQAISYDDPATVEFTFASPPTITKGTGYKLAIIESAAFAAKIMHNDAVSPTLDYDATGTYASPPTSLTTTNVADGRLAIWGVV